jgi:hypothetical protein
MAREVGLDAVRAAQIICPLLLLIGGFGLYRVVEQAQTDRRSLGTAVLLLLMSLAIWLVQVFVGYPMFGMVPDPDWQPGLKVGGGWFSVVLWLTLPILVGSSLMACRRWMTNSSALVASSILVGVAAAAVEPSLNHVNWWGWSLEPLFGSGIHVLAPVGWLVSSLFMGIVLGKRLDQAELDRAEPGLTFLAVVLLLGTIGFVSAPI